jgi:hypothetical protein
MGQAGGSNKKVTVRARGSMRGEAWGKKEGNVLRSPIVHTVNAASEGVKSTGVSSSWNGYILATVSEGVLSMEFESSPHKDQCSVPTQSHLPH